MFDIVLMVGMPGSGKTMFCVGSFFMKVHESVIVEG